MKLPNDNNYLVVKLTPDQFNTDTQVYWFNHWHNGDTWLDGYEAESAYEALMKAKDNHADKSNVLIELIDNYPTALLQ